VTNKIAKLAPTSILISLNSCEKYPTIDQSRWKMTSLCPSRPLWFILFYSVVTQIFPNGIILNFTRKYDRVFRTQVNDEKFTSPFKQSALGRD